ncbi:MAG: N-acetyl-gamma-glutamyl-phosphate reductase [Erythrobacter sp.]
MAIRLFIDGAAGTTGLEIRERLAGRSEFELLVLDDAQRKDEAARRDALRAADIAILCLPDEAAKEAVKFAEGSGTRIIDASSAHRVAHGWAYGFPELVGHETIANAQLVSNPGCYPTGFLAAVAPLVRAGLLPADWPYTVNAVSGYSGGGHALIERFEADPTIALRAYGLSLGHKHLPEMQTYAGLRHAPVFSPAVVPAHRGMVVDVPLALCAMPSPPDAATLRTALAAHFDGNTVVAVDRAELPAAELLLRADAAPWDGMRLYVFGSEDGTQARLVAVLDNLGKGASGAAIQNLNLMCGLPETTGLRL